MSKIEIKVKGLKELRTAFKKTPAVLNKEMAAAFDEIGDIIVKGAKEEVPQYGKSMSEHGYKPTNALKRSIRSKPLGHRGVKVIAGGEGTGVDYAVYVHEGLGRHRKWGPRPFMVNGAEKQRDDITARFQEMFDNVTALIPAKKKGKVRARVVSFIARVRQ